MSERKDRQRIGVFGATGSVGKSTLDVIAQHPERYEVTALAAHQDTAGMEALARAFHPHYVVMANPQAASDLRRALSDVANIAVWSGPEALVEMAADPDIDTVVAAIVGAAGLPACLAAVEAGKRILLANKEALVVAGDLLIHAARASGATLLPIDSEHNGLFQCLPVDARGVADLSGVEQLWLTASGGPFRERDPATLASVSVEQACAHPNWTMGQKISVDSATMMNKGLEVIEACRLFGLPASQVAVVIHPQSLVHAVVQYRDGSMLAQLGAADMRTPIAQALAWPDRLESGVSALDLATIGSLEFSPPDEQRFPCLALARQALMQSPGATVALNAANEVAVEAFLSRSLRFDRIAGVIDATLSGMEHTVDTVLEALLDHDQRARAYAHQHLRQWSQ